ncbi:MAG: SnoaL-like domain-containing protein [Halioglobus sp.]|nr:SnoaL-like domain-containing protein [Halioglobus sp.]
MARWKRKEIEAAFEKYQEAALKGAQTKDWTDWANCFTEDATYVEHHYGRFWGRQRILDWITDTMTTGFATQMTAFPISWYSIDADRGWIFCEVMNRMEDLGDGKIYEEPNITILHYAGNGLFSYEEDAYNPANMGTMVTAWMDAKKKIEAEAS